mmetsp:Transcript_13218/g.31275  ORF Transcript_13218/g.31275 Transcript_13218/m.31275 type:complete len:211 (-) Transcript_13218:120-752(-)
MEALSWPLTVEEDTLRSLSRFFEERILSNVVSGSSISIVHRVFLRSASPESIPSIIALIMAMTSSRSPSHAATSSLNILLSKDDTPSIRLIPAMSRSISLSSMVKLPSLSMSRTRVMTSSSVLLFSTTLIPLFIILFSSIRLISSSSCDPCVSDSSRRAISMSFIRSTSDWRSSISAERMSFCSVSLPCCSRIPLRAARNVSSFVSWRSL